jgi:hypothetical protein
MLKTWGLLLMVATTSLQVSAPAPQQTGSLPSVPIR